MNERPDTAEDLKYRARVYMAQARVFLNRGDVQFASTLVSWARRRWHEALRIREPVQGVLL